MKENHLNININTQKEDLLNWKKELENNLSKNSFKKEELFIISRYWLDNYEKYLLNINNIEDKSFNYEENKEMNNQLFSPFEEKCRNIEKLPKIFVINKNFRNNIKNENNELNFINAVGVYDNKILILKVLESIYSFFFLDIKKQIRQGYLLVIRLDWEKDMIKYFMKNGLFNFIKKNENELNDDKLEMLKDGCKIYIFENYDKNEKNNNYQNEFNKEEILKSRKKTINLKKSQIYNNPDKINYVFGSNIFNIHKSIIVNLGKVMGKLEKSIFKNSSNVKEKDDIKSNNEEIKNKQNNKNSEENKTIINTEINAFSEKIIEPEKHHLTTIPRIKNHNNFQQFFPSPPKQKISNPGLIGLENIGATCYMNSTLQCFSNIKDLRLYLLREDKYKFLENNKNKFRLSFALAEVLYNLWKNLNHNYYAPEYFKKMIGEMNPLFKGIAANDPKDLILFLLETIHKELNRPSNTQMNHNFYLDNTNFYAVYNDFINYFICENKSIISNLFYGLTNSMTTCGFCRTTIHNVQAINILFFPLEEVRKFMNYTNNFVFIEDCFRYYEKQEIYPSFYCNNCRQLYPGYNQSKIIYSPFNLIINLNRGRGLQFNINIGIKEYLNIRNYTFANDSPFYYELIGVICHLGSNDMGGHFIAFCKNSNNCQWYKYNDGIVTLSSFQEASNTGIIYVLFYSYIKV